MPPSIDPQTQRAALAGDPEAKTNKQPSYINIPADVQAFLIALSPLWFAILLMFCARSSK